MAKRSYLHLCFDARGPPRYINNNLDVAGNNSMGHCTFPMPFAGEHMKYSQQIIARRLNNDKGESGKNGFVKFPWTWKPTGSGCPGGLPL